MNNNMDINRYYECIKCVEYHTGKYKNHHLGEVITYIHNMIFECEFDAELYVRIHLKVFEKVNTDNIVIAILLMMKSGNRKLKYYTLKSFIRSRIKNGYSKEC